MESSKQIAKNIVQRIINDLSNRSSLSGALDGIDSDTMNEIMGTWENIVLGEISDDVEGALRVTITKLVKTCNACPAQWDLWDSEGNYYYVRYRHGQFRVEDKNSQVICDRSPNTYSDGCMSFEEMEELTRDIFIFDAEGTYE